MKEEILKYYYPFCREKACNGILDIEINEDNSSIISICEKNKNHKNKNIYYKTFERFYLKEMNIKKCSKCDIILETDIRYQCKNCNRIYCGSCYLYDEHIKNNNQELLIINDKCKKHKKDLTLYCSKCNEHLCIYCIENNEDNIHYNHNIKNLYEIIPSQKELNEIKDDINKIKNIYEEYISLLDNWKIKIKNKIDNYQQNLRDKISLFEKMFYNFNRYYNNYTYYNNFRYFNDYIMSHNDLSNAEMLIKSNNFNSFKKILTEIFYIKEEEEIEITESKIYELHIPFNFRIKKIEKINNTHFFINGNNSVRLIKYEEKFDQLNIMENTRIDFNDNIESITPSLKKDKIYACLSGSKKIKIFNCDLINEIMELDTHEIVGDDNIDNKFKKCIELPNNILAAIEGSDRVISLWNLNNYTCINKISLNTVIGNLLLLNDNYFISSQPKEETLIFYNINNINEKKIIHKVKSSDNIHCLDSNQNYIIIFCPKGISIISIKFKELIQFFETNIKYHSCIKIDENDFIYHLYLDSDSFSKSDYLKFDIFKLEKDKIVKFISGEKNTNHESEDANLNIGYLNKKKSLIIGEGRIFTCERYDLDEYNKELK